MMVNCRVPKKQSSLMKPGVIMAGLEGGFYARNVDEEWQYCMILVLYSHAGHAVMWSMALSKNPHCIGYSEKLKSYEKDLI